MDYQEKGFIDKVWSAGDEEKKVQEKKSLNLDTVLMSFGMFAVSPPKSPPESTFMSPWNMQAEDSTDEGVGTGAESAADTQHHQLADREGEELTRMEAAHSRLVPALRDVYQEMCAAYLGR